MKELNSKRFIFLLSIPFLACVTIYFTNNILDYYKVSEIGKDCLIKLILIIFITIKIILITYDITNLKELNLYCPYWVLAIIFPIYLFLRQYRNNLGLGYFAYYWILNFITPKFLSYLINII